MNMAVEAIHARQVVRHIKSLLHKALDNYIDTYHAPTAEQVKDAVERYLGTLPETNRPRTTDAWTPDRQETEVRHRVTRAGHRRPVYEETVYGHGLTGTVYSAKQGATRRLRVLAELRKTVERNMPNSVYAEVSVAPVNPLNHITITARLEKQK